MTSVPVSTSYLPLTTTFTAPASCWNNPWMLQNVPTTWWKQGGDLNPTCFPPAFPFSISRLIYSPGICPAGWTSACAQTITTTGSTQKVVSCCPPSFTCAQTSRAVHDWEDEFGCASSYSIDIGVWGVKSGSLFVSSMYQIPVMVVSANPTSSSSILSSSSSASPGSTPASSPTGAGNSSTSPSTNTGLSKGAIAGIAIGSIVGLAVIALLAYIALAIRRRNRLNNNMHDPTAQPHKGYTAPEGWTAPEYYGGEQYYGTQQNYYDAPPTEMEGQPRPVYELKAPHT